MHINKIMIKNYRRFEDVEICFSKNLTLLAGANNSGKTSLVHLLDCIFSNTASLKPKDIAIIRQGEIRRRLFDSVFISSLLSYKNSKDFQTQICELFFGQC